MTSAEAIRELRSLIVQGAHAGLPREQLNYMLATVAEIVRDGIDPVIELRIRLFRRRVRMRQAGNGTGPAVTLP